jgi:phospholipase C
MARSAARAMDHVVLVVFENRSFDNLLGHLYTPEEQPDFEGVIGKALKNPVPAWAPPIPPSEEGPEPGYVYYGTAPGLDVPNPDPGEEYQHTNTQLFNILAPENRGKRAHDMPSTNAPDQPDQVPGMDGFVTDYISNCLALDEALPEFAEYRQIMQGHTPDQVPVLSALARGFAVFDHWFSEVPSQTFPNRSFWTAATSSGLVVNAPAQRWYFDNDAETIFDRLEAHGRTWKVYVLEPCPLSITGAIHTPRLKPHFHDRFVPFEQFERDARDGTLPDFSLIEPNLLAGHADYHPPFGDALIDGFDLNVDVGSAVTAGEGFLARLYRAVKDAPSGDGPTAGASTVWNTTLFIGWDEPGGTYDHVPPPMVEPPDDHAGQFDFGFDRSGYRVPAIMVSPWLPPRTLVTEEYRHTSMIATLRTVWDLGKELTHRDGSARTFDHLFTLAEPRDPSTWPSVEALAPTDAAVDPVTVMASLGSLGRHLVHGLVHLCRAHDHDVEPDDFNPEVDVPPQFFVEAARRFGGHFFPLLERPDRPHPVAPDGGSGPVPGTRDGAPGRTARVD